METKKLYLTNWDFNIARMLQRLEKIIDDNGGYFVSYYFTDFDNYELQSRYTNKVIFTHFKNYMNFVLDDVYYYVEISDNPFFDFTIIKYPLDENNYRHYGEHINKSSWCFDCLLSADCNDDEIKEIANLFFNEIVTAKNCSIVKKRQRVYYSGGRYSYTYKAEKNTSPFNKLNVLKNLFYIYLQLL